MTGVILIVTRPIKYICCDRISSENRPMTSMLFCTVTLFWTVTRSHFILSGAPIHNQKDLICLLMASLEDDGRHKGSVSPIKSVLHTLSSYKSTQIVFYGNFIKYCKLILIYGSYDICVLSYTGMNATLGIYVQWILYFCKYVIS